MVRQPAESRFKVTLHRPMVGLHLPSVKRGAVVVDGEAEAVLSGSIHREKVDRPSPKSSNASDTMIGRKAARPLGFLLYRSCS